MTNSTLNDKKTVMFGNRERDYSVDLVRSISCLMVVAIHVCAFMMSKCPYDETVGVTSDWFCLATLKCITVSATNIFLMISGIFFLSPERNVSISKIWSKNILKLAVAYVLWCMIYAYYRICFTNGGQFEWPLFWQETLNREFHLWYIPMMLGIYVVVPLMRVFTANAQRKHYMYMIGLMIGAMTLNTLRIFSVDYAYYGSESITTIIDYTPTALICQYPFYCILGYYIYTYRPLRKTRILLYVLGIAGIILMIWLTTFFYVETGVTNPDRMQDKFTIGVLAKNTAIFVFIITVFSNVEMSALFKKVLSKISSATLFIYLSHVLFLRLFLYNGWLLNMGFDLFVVACIYILLIYAVAFVFSFLFLQLIPWTFFRNIIMDALWPNRKIWNGGKHRKAKERIL